MSSDDERAILLALCQEQWAQARHTEGHRATFGTFTLAAVAAVAALMSRRDITRAAIPLTLLLTVLGLFGVAFTFKLYELFHFHHDKAKAWQRLLEAARPDLLLRETEEKAEADHRAGWKLSRYRAHHFWAALFGVVAALGLVLTVIAAFSPAPATPPDPPPTSTRAARVRNARPTLRHGRILVYRRASIDTRAAAPCTLPEPMSADTQ